ncbi:MAG: TIGR03619 family F420-dependent LLM class oxidoreductase [Alphaproteobacteria bacterium]|nr:TIGR03619 family F420-dependent LLM class oxidoreductase [Alphaproteobacteria bacterium]
MRIGFNAPVAGSLSTPEALTRIAVEGEAMGYDYAAFSDHVVIPTDIQARYPYSDTGEFPQGARGARHEQLTAMMFVAAKTSRLRLVSSVMVVPHRPAVLTAKMLSTIDVLSGGRLTVGIGAGWLKEEFEALGLPPYAERGAVTDEYIRVFHELWTKDDPRFAGKYAQFENITFAPKPAQRPHPPIWVGGESGPALRRTARLGDGWYPIGTNPAHRLDTLARYRAGIARLHGLIAEAGRKPADVALVYRVARHGTELPAKADDGDRRLFSGSPAEMAGDLRDLRALGVSDIDFSFIADTVEATLGGMQRFRDEVVARV